MSVRRFTWFYDRMGETKYGNFVEYWAYQELEKEVRRLKSQKEDLETRLADLTARRTVVTPEGDR